MREVQQSAWVEDGLEGRSAGPRVGHDSRARRVRHAGGPAAERLRAGAPRHLHRNARDGHRVPRWWHAPPAAVGEVQR